MTPNELDSEKQIYWVDLRQKSAFDRVHFFESGCLSWPSTQQRMNELPIPGSHLCLVGAASDLNQATAFLVERGYFIEDRVNFPSELAKQLYLDQHQNLPLPKVCSENGKCLNDLLIFDSPDETLLWSPSDIAGWISERKSTLFDTIVSPRVLDLGCGGGRDAVYLNRQGFDVTGVEHKPTVLAKAKALASYHAFDQRIRFHGCDLTHPSCLPLELNGSFDLVMGVRFLHRESFPRIRQLIKPGGLIAWQTFYAGCERLGSPRRQQFILQPEEMAKTFQDFEVYLDRIDRLKDGRPVQTFVAKKQ